MAITAIHGWNAPDSSELINRRFRFVSKGVFSGGLITPVADQLKVSVAPFEAMSHDGMLLEDKSPTVLSVEANRTNYILLYAQYRLNGPPYTKWHVYSEEEYQEKLEGGAGDYYLLFAVVTLDEEAVSVSSPDISYAGRHAFDPVGRSILRGAVADEEALATIADVSPTLLRPGDVYIVLTTHDAHVWDGSAFQRASDLNQTRLSWETVQREEQTRRTEESGLIWNGYRNNTSLAYSEAEGTPFLYNLPIETDGTNVLTLRACSFLINGQLLTLPKTSIELRARPDVGGVYDGVLLEVWCEPIESIIDQTFLTPDSTELTLAQAITLFESAAIDPNDDADLNAHLASIRIAHDGKLLRTRYRLVECEDVTNGFLPRITLPCLDFNGQTNADGNPFSYISAFSTESGEPKSDCESLLRADYEGAYPPYSFAIPLLIVRRTSSESSADGSVDVESTPRTVFDVTPLTRSSRLRKAEAIRRWAGSTGQVNSEAHRLRRSLPSGFLSGVEQDLLPVPADSSVQAPCVVRIPASVMSFNGVLVSVPSTDITHPAAPSFLGTGTRNLTVAEADIVRWPDPESAISLIPDLIDDEGNLYYCSVSYRTVETSALDIESAMQAAGYSITADNRWTRSPGDASKGSLSGSAREALPVLLLHRRNTQAFASNNPNGSGNSRPDGYEHYIAYFDDMLDLRSKIVRSKAEFEHLFTKSYELLQRGLLTTNMKVHPRSGWSSVAGTAHLHMDFVSRRTGPALVVGSPTTACWHEVSAGTNGLRSVVNGIRGVWSWADEVQPLHMVMTDLEGDGEVIKLGPLADYGVADGNRVVEIGLPDSAGVGFAEVVLTAPEGAVWVMASAENILVRAYRVLSDGNRSLSTYAAVDGELIEYVGQEGFDSPVNVTSATIKVPNAFRTDTGIKWLELYCTFKAREPGDNAEGRLAVNQGLYGTPDHVLEVKMYGDMADDGSFSFECPTQCPTVTLSGEIVDQVITYSAPAGRTFVGLDFLDRWRDGGLSCPERESETRSSWHIEDFEGLPSGVFTNEADSEVTCSDDMATLRLKLGVNTFNSLTGVVKLPVRDTTTNTRWVEFHRSSQGFSGYYLWASLDFTTQSNSEYIHASEFRQKAGEKVSPQTMFNHGFEPEIDLFLWLDTGNADEERWRLIPSKTDNGTVWSVTMGDLCKSSLGLNFNSDGEYDLTGGGHDLRIMARMWMPPPLSNWDQDNSEENLERTDAISIVYKSYPYQGVNTDTSTGIPHGVSVYQGKVVHADREVIVSSVGRVPLYREVGRLAAGAVIAKHHDAAYASILPVRRNRPVGSKSGGLNLVHLPLVERVSEAGETALGDWFFRLFKHVCGRSFSIGGDQGVTLRSAVLSSGPWDVIRSGLDMTLPDVDYVALEECLKTYNLSEVFDSFLGDKARGQYLPLYNDWTGYVVEGLSSLGPRPGYETRRVVTAASQATDIAEETDFNWTVAQAYVDGPLDSSDTLKHNLLGNENSVSREPVGLLSYHAYAIQAKGPITQRGSIFMIVHTKISNKEPDNLRDRIPGEAFDAFYLLHRPVLAD